MRIGAVYHLNEKVCLRHFLECRFKRLDEGGGKFVDKADRIGQKEFLSSRHCDTPDGRIEGRKEHIRFKDLPLIRFTFRYCVGGVLSQHRIHDRRLSGVGISHKGYQRDSGSLPLFALRSALPADALEFLGQLAEPVVNGAAVDFQLGLAFALGGHRARGAALAVLGLPHTDQPGL